MVAVSSRPSASRCAAPVVERREPGAADRDVGLPEAPRAAEAVGDHDRGRRSPSRGAHASCAEPSGSSGQQADDVVARHVRLVDARVRAHEPVARARDQHAALGAQHLGALVEHHLHHARVLVERVRQLAARAPTAARRPAATSRPSAFETTFWLRTTTSPRPIATPALAATSAINSARSSPGRHLRHARHDLLRTAPQRSSRGGADAADLAQHSARARCAPVHVVERADELRRDRRRCRRRGRAKEPCVTTCSRPFVLRLLHVARQRVRAELRLERARRVEQERVGARVVAVGHDHDVLRRRSRARAGRAPPGRPAGSRPGPAAPARSPSPPRAPARPARPATAPCRRSRRSRSRRPRRRASARRARRRRPGRRRAPRPAGSEPARPRTSRPRAPRAWRPRASRPSRCLAWSNRFTGRIAAVATAGGTLCQGGGEVEGLAGEPAAALGAVHHRCRSGAGRSPRRTAGRWASRGRRPCPAPGPRSAAATPPSSTGRPAQRMNSSVGPLQGAARRPAG